ncbi:helix-turn-helix transcriptional regulator [Actinomadura barringtoniae]|uniref:Helix-turn-helix transcriptional regulator n=1 Tax=Actinomadura barringtoniae TaxID=1427535 RepID=A0A939PAT1_9ACTN|nr:AAA family ATPase [Actinomadura barringtoniae]MBO2449008.1 helix-turn-helix transcriptional regulator [Actinomadura barringtoniae]
MRLFGRSAEVDRIGRLLADARRGRSGALYVHGEAGIGKSALFEHAARAAESAGIRVLSAVGTETEAELPFAGLHLLLTSYEGDLDAHIRALNLSQAAALHGALGGTPVAGEDRFLIGLATLTLLSDLAEDGPIACVVDDAQWLDRASLEALLFAARRLRSEGVVLLFAARDEPGMPSLLGIPEVRLEPLTAEDAASLLASVAPDLPAPVRARVLSESEGNPLALIELPKAVGAEGWPPMGPVPIGDRVQRAFAAQIERLPARARNLLALAAADDSGELGVIMRAAKTLAIPSGAIEPAERAGLVNVVRGVLRFRHPLVRSAAYQGAVAAERRAAHRALAQAWHEDSDADRRAWQLAAAATGPDDEVADLLERTAKRAADRNGHAAVVAAYERSAQLSSKPSAAGRRSVAAALAATDAGLLDRAAELSELGAHTAAQPADLAMLSLIRGLVEFERGWPREAGRVMIDGALRITAERPVDAAYLLVIGVHNAWHGGDRLMVAEGVKWLREVRVPPDDPIAAFVDVTVALGHLAADDAASADPLLRAFALVARDLTPRTTWLRQYTAQLLLVAGHAPVLAHELASTMTLMGRSRGQAGHLTGALHHLAYAQILLGRHGVAAASATEGLELARVTGQRPLAAHLSSVLAWLVAQQGDEQRCRDLAGDAIRYAEEHHSPHSAISGHWALALLDLGMGRHIEAYERMAGNWRGWTYIANRSVADLVEAAVHVGKADRARAAVAEVEEWTPGGADPWARAILVRCRALLADDTAAEELFAQALRLHEESEQPYEQARTWLAYGEWLRRTRRRKEARGPLRNALESFERLGATVWADRARTELRAAGERAVRKRAKNDAASELTPQEQQVVRLAATGATNREIAAQLLISPRTVGQHLYNAFPKLGVSSRAELGRLGLETP